jgi:hypothetical protein
MNHSRLHNPKYSGPGIWFSIHIMAFNAKTQKEKESVIKQIRIIQQNFPCQECKTHFGSYLENHPPEATIKEGPEALFLWTVNFHNSVNYRRGYPQVSFEEAKSIYSGNDIFCMKSSCEDEQEEISEDKPVVLKSPKRTGTLTLAPADMICAKKYMK